jgi:hypothetical protein
MTDRSSGEHDTETMARVYLEQGKVDEAAAIYHRLLDRAADDAGQIEHLGSLLAASETRRADARRRVAQPAAAVSTAPEMELCALVPQGPGQATCLWEVTPRGRGAAQRQLADAPGRLVLRVVVWAFGTPRSDAARWDRDFGADADTGGRVVELPAEGGLATAAIGLRSPGGAFAAIAHAAPRLVPGALPAAGPAAELMEVAPAESATEPEPAEGRIVAP